MDTNTKPRTLVLCFDGTTNEYDDTNTNVVKLFALLKKDNVEQLTFYQAGVGTWFQPGIVSPMFEWGAKLMDQAVAWYLGAHIIEGYKFLMDNHRNGDKICIFGFSRGAYTARALGGFLYKVGLLSQGNLSQVSFAYKMYKRTDAKGLKLCAGFKQTYCRPVTIEFMGVWDTVCSVGALWSPTLPFTNSNSAVKIFRHALSLDEHRTKFRPNYYHRTPPGAADAVETGEPEDVKEVWFVGCHSDIGGGSVSNDVEQSLSNISLRWMVREIIAAGFGAIFDASALARAKIDLDPEPSIPEKEMDSTDALEKLHDQLGANVLWWLLEMLPFPYSLQNTNNVWQTSYVPNMGRGRKIVDPHPTMHVTIKKRMESQLKYKPKARWTPNSEVYVD